MKCFLSYSSAYAHLLAPIRGLLESLDFDVDVFDGPDIEHPPAHVVEKRLAAADAVVVLLGPSAPPPSDLHGAEPAQWPAEEAAFARALKKPTALVVHPGTRLPKLLENVQTPPHFGFWDPESFRDRIPFLVKHLLDLRRQVELPPGSSPFVYRKVVLRNRIRRSSLLIHLYHEVVARQPWAEFHHVLDTGLDATADAKIALVSPDAYEVDSTVGAAQHSAGLRFGETKANAIEYYVTATPPLLPGERFGYSREFEVENYWPLSRAALKARAEQVGFPELYRHDEHTYYGDAYDVVFELDELRIAFHFPRRIRVRRVRAVAATYLGRRINVEETERCNSSECLTLQELPEEGERLISLVIRRPLINHTYLLLFAPED